MRPQVIAEFPPGSDGLGADGLWLGPRCQHTDKPAKLLRPSPSGDMLAYRVSLVVNDPRNDVPQCVEAIR